MNKTIKIVISICVLAICVYAYSVVPVGAIEKTKPDPAGNALFNSIKKKKNSGGSKSSPPLTATSGQSGEDASASWPWPGYHKDGYKIYDDEPEEEEQVECLSSHRKKLAEINKGIIKFLEVGDDLKSQAGDVKNKRGLRKMVKKVDENQKNLIGLNLPKYAKYYKACGIEMPYTGMYQMHVLVEGVHQ